MALFFLMCSERSGSNFTTKLLNGHNKVCGPSTKHVLNPLARNLFRYGDLSARGNWEVLLQDIHRLLSVDFSLWRKTFSLQELRELAAPGDVKTLVQNLFLEEARANGKEHVLIKENHIYEFFPFLLAHFPESKYLYQSRDPRDMALSWKNNPDHVGGVVRAARQWKLDQQQSLKNFALLRPQGKAYFVKYEDLISNAYEEVTNLVNFFGVPFDDGIFDFYRDGLTRENAQKQRAWSNLEKGIISNNSGKYRENLSSEEVMTVEKLCFYEMRYLSYQPEFTESQLLKVSDGWIEQFHEKEMAALELRRSDGVTANMAAKKAFYTREIGNVSDYQIYSEGAISPKSGR